MLDRKFDDSTTILTDKSCDSSSKERLLKKINFLVLDKFTQNNDNMERIDILWAIDTGLKLNDDQINAFISNAIYKGYVRYLQFILKKFL